MSASEVVGLVVDATIAVATLAAVAVAILSARHEAAARSRAEARAEASEAARDAERKAADEERQERESAAAERARTAQALLVTAWPEWAATARGIAGHTFGHWKVFVGNFSSAPIYDVEVQALDRNGDLAALMNLPVVPPGERHAFTTEHNDESQPPTAVILFRDIAGLLWQRRQSGELQFIHTDLRKGHL